MNGSPLDYQEVTELHLDCQEEIQKTSSARPAAGIPEA
jgi:hypothetical protein